MRHAPPRKAPQASWRTGLWGLLIGLGIAFGLSYAKPRNGPPALPSSGAAELPPEAGRRLQLGRQYLREARLREGQVELEEALRLAPESAEILHVLGQACLLQKRFESAAGYLKQALVREPSRVRAMVDLALALRELGQAREAAEMAERAAALAPGERKVKVLLGQNLLRANEPRRAAAVLQGVIADGGADATDYLALARAQDLQGERAAAQAAFRQAIHLDPGLPLAHYWYAQHLQRVGSRADAEVEIAAYRKTSAAHARLLRLEQGVQIDPRNARLWADLASALLERGDPKRARQALDRAAQLAPESPEVRSVRAALDRIPKP